MPVSSMTGQDAEKLVVDFLQKNSFCIIECNYRIARGEIDIIAQDGPTLVFTEVKYLKNVRSYYPEEQVHYVKQKKIIRTAHSYLQKTGFSGPCRFDVISVSPNEGAKGEYHFHHIKNAFTDCD